ncbi:MAG: class I SAM-dependent methyltransferase [Clostridia bacterium]|nr:class I SAM-dependent methyltransferase [Clostridia bacterium]
MLSKRLQRVADTVRKSNVIADIGTDHAYIPIYLVKKGIAERAVAADISAGSCKKAQLNINNNHLSDLISVRCGNGLEVIDKNENIDTIIIGGMGGLMAISVLESNREAVSNAKQLVLQPQRDIDKVRRYIHSIGFRIVNENMLIDGDKFYNIIDAEKGTEEYSEIEYLFGKCLIDSKSMILKEYAEIELNKLLTVLKNMKDNGKDNEQAYDRLNKLKCSYLEVIKCL